MWGEQRKRVGTLSRAIIQLVLLAALMALSGFVAVAQAIDGPAGDDPIDGGVGPVPPVLTTSTCKNEEEEIPVCGRKETVTRLCAFPYVTAAMAEEAKKHEELTEEYQRTNGCVSTDPACTAHDDKVGGAELAEEVMRDSGEDMPTKIRFHLSLTNSDIVKARDDMALVSRKGFTRDIITHHLLYRVHSDQKFNEDAEGVNLAAKKVTDHEREELLKLADVLKEMKDLFHQRGDKESEKNTEGFETIARTRALELEGASCELGRLAAKNRRIENRMKQITLDAAKETYGQGGPDSPAQAMAVNDITGIKDQPGLPDPGVPEIKIGPPKTDDKKGLSAVESGGTASGAATNTTGSSAPPPNMSGSSSPGPTRAPASDPDSLQSIFGPDPDAVRREFQENLAAPADVTEENNALFDRVRRQYRARYLQGEFRPSLVD